MGVSAYVATECVAVAAHAIQNSFSFFLFFRSGVAVYVVLTFAYVNVRKRIAYVNVRKHKET